MSTLRQWDTYTIDLFDGAGKEYIATNVLECDLDTALTHTVGLSMAGIVAIIRMKD